MRHGHTRRRVVVVAALLACPTGLQGQGVPVDSAPVPGSELTISLVTIGPGAQVWERFGHNMLWVQGGVTPVDSVWDWGRFQFDRGFFLRFARGDLRYWMKGGDAASYLPWYIATGRTVTAQELALTPDQRLRLLAMLRANDTDANRYYQYHYYNDNCSTRIRDALDTVLGGALRARTDTVITAWSYRDQTRRLNQHNPLLYLGLTTLLAGATDRRITAWEEMFLPGYVERWVREVQVPGAAGAPVPLVAREEVLAPGGRYPVPEAPSQWWPGFLLVGLAIGGVAAATGRARTGWRRAFLFTAGSYALMVGFLGLTMALLWAVSGHQVAWRNENLWQFNLAALALVPMLPGAARGEGRRAATARWLALLILGCSLVGLALKLLPGIDQANWDVIALAVPANLGLALGVLGRARGAVRGER